MLFIGLARTKPTQEEYERKQCLLELDPVPDLEQCIIDDRELPYIPARCVDKWDFVRRYQIDFCRCLLERADKFEESEIKCVDSDSTRMYFNPTEHKIVTHIDSRRLSEEENSIRLDKESRFKKVLLENGLVEAIPENHKESPKHEEYLARKQRDEEAAKIQAEEYEQLQKELDEQLERVRQEQEERDRQEAERRKNDWSGVFGFAFFIVLVISCGINVCMEEQKQRQKRWERVMKEK